MAIRNIHVRSSPYGVRARGVEEPSLLWQFVLKLYIITFVMKEHLLQFKNLI